MNKKKRIGIVFSFLIFILIAGIVYVKAEDEPKILNTSEYILENINENYAKANKLEPKDIIDVKQTMADGTKLAPEQTIDAMYEKTPDAFIIMSEAYMPMYNTDDESEYYVAYVDTMHNDENSRISDLSFAYTNIDGEVITDAIYDDKTGIAYIPKKYTEENKNGQGIMNVQVQFLQVCNSSEPTTTIKTIVDVGDGFDGDILKSGYLQMSAIDTEIKINIAKDDKAKESIKATDIVVKKNGYETKALKYNSKSGDVTIANSMPTEADTIEISINKENNNTDVQDVSNGIMTIAPSGNADFNSNMWTGNTVWKASNVPSAGSTISISGVGLTYHEGAGNRLLPDQDNMAYVPGRALTDDIQGLINAMLDGSSGIDSSHLVSASYFMSWTLTFPEGMTIDYNGTTFTVPQSTYEVRCGHNMRSFAEGVGNTIYFRIFEVNLNDQTMLIGVLTPYHDSQSGTALYKVRYETEPQKGKIKVHKYENGTNIPIEGVEFDLYNRDTGAYIGYITTNSEGYGEWGDLPLGNYYLKERNAPGKYVIDGSEHDLTISRDNLEPELTVYNDKVHGKLRIYKQEGNKKVPIEGVEFDILDEAGNVVDHVTTGPDGYATTKELEAGNYRFKEVGAPPYIVKNETEMNFSITRDNPNPEMVFDNTTVTGKGKMYKFDEYGDPIEGVKFQIYDAEMNPISVMTTGPDGYAESIELEYGNYYYQEIYAPDPDIKIDDGIYPFSITENGKIEGFSMKNNYERGSLKLKKVDEWGVGIAGCVFHIKGGPEKEPIDDDYTTDSNGEIFLENIRTGDYTITETDVPANLVLNTETVTVTVEAEAEATYTVENEYARGELGIQKEDVFTQEGKKNYGDGNYAGIVVELHAAEDIYEGETLVLKKDELVATRTFRADGTTETVREFYRQGDNEYFDGLPIGRYYWKEVKTNASYLAPADAEVAEAQKVEYYQEFFYVDEYTHDIPSMSTTMYDQEVMTRLEVVKHDDYSMNGPDDHTHTEKNPAEGAVLRLTLKSNYNPETRQPIDPTRDTYTVTIDEYGHGVFVNPEFEELHMEERGMDPRYTIPYGTYIVSEEKVSNNGKDYFYGIQDQEINLYEDQKLYTLLFQDNPIPVFLELVKKDADTDDANGEEKETVKIAGARFKIWDCQANKWIEQEVPGSGLPIDEFTTNDDGIFITPKKLYAGKYIIYETHAPDGYYLNEALRIPTVDGTPDGEYDMSKVGNTEYGGFAINIYDGALYVDDAEQYPDIGETPPYEWLVDNLKISFSVYDETTRGNIELYKQGEMFTEINEINKEYTADGYMDELTEYEPQYDYEFLPGCLFEVSPVEDVVTLDGRVKEIAGTKHYILTGNDGRGICRKDRGTGEEDRLFCNPEGTVYKIHEIECPAGYEPCEDFTVTVYPGDEYTKVNLNNTEAFDDYIPVKVRIDKDFIKENENGEIFSNVDNDGQKAVAIFGIFTNQDFISVHGRELPADTLIESLRVVEGEGFVESYKLPDGEYYLEELYTTPPYTVVDKDTKLPHRYEFTVEHKKGDYNEQEVNVEITNDFPKGDLYVIKVSATGVTQEEGLMVRNTDEYSEEVQEAIDNYSDYINQLLASNPDKDVSSVIEEALAKYSIAGNYTLSEPARYQVYLDKECTKPLRRSLNGGVTWVDVVLDVQVDEATGSYLSCYSVKGIPEGRYYVKEVKSPVYFDSDLNERKYDVSNLVKEIVVTDNSGSVLDNTIFRVLSDESSKSTVEKFDLFTGKAVPECVFTITDEEGTELLHFITDENGEANIPTDIFEDGKKYYFTELSAPGFPYCDKDGTLYELNTEPHEFTAHIDESGDWVYEDENKVEYERPEIENMRPITDVTFEKQDYMDSSPVPNCKFRLESKETDWYVEGTTDENGVYVFENVPYGDYLYTELEAPDEYMIDTTPHDLRVDTAHVKVVVKDLKWEDVDTGDIAVIAISIIAIVSVVGIIVVIIKNKKSRKEN